MSILWNKLYNVVSSVINPNPPSGMYSISSHQFHRSFENKYRKRASTNPFFNFMTVVRSQSNFGPGTPPSTQRKLTRTAGIIWKQMSETEKRPYRKVASEQTRIEQYEKSRQKTLRQSRRTRLSMAAIKERQSRVSRYSKGLKMNTASNKYKPQKTSKCPKSVTKPQSHIAKPLSRFAKAQSRASKPVTRSAKTIGRSAKTIGRSAKTIGRSAKTIGRSSKPKGRPAKLRCPTAKTLSQCVKRQMRQLKSAKSRKGQAKQPLRKPQSKPRPSPCGHTTPHTPQPSRPAENCHGALDSKGNVVNFWGTPMEVRNPANSNNSALLFPRTFPSMHPITRDSATTVRSESSGSSNDSEDLNNPSESAETLARNTWINSKVNHDYYLKCYGRKQQNSLKEFYRTMHANRLNRMAVNSVSDLRAQPSCCARKGFGKSKAVKKELNPISYGGTFDASKQNPGNASPTMNSYIERYSPYFPWNLGRNLAMFQNLNQQRQPNANFRSDVPKRAVSLNQKKPCLKNNKLNCTNTRACPSIPFWIPNPMRPEQHNWWKYEPTQAEAAHRSKMAFGCPPRRF